MAAATAERQQWLIERMSAAGVEYRAGETFAWRSLADTLNRHP
jgi:hypothetical protein